MAALTVLDGARPGERVVLDTLPVGEARVVRATDRRTATPALRLRRSAEGYHVEDGGDAEIRVNGRKPGGSPLAHGDLLAAGPLVCIFSEDDEVAEGRGKDGPDAFETSVDLRVPPVADLVEAAAAAGRGAVGEGRAATLLAMAARLAGPHEPATVLAEAADTALACLPVQRALATAFRPDRRGPGEVVARRALGAGDAPPLQVSRAVAEAVMRTGETVGSVDRVPGVPTAVRSALCAPLVAGGQVIGLVHADLPGVTRPFSPEDARTLALVGQLAGGALAVARAAADRERHARRLRALAAASRRLPNVLRRDAVVRQAAALAAAILGCRRTSILLRDEAGTLRVAGGVGLPDRVAGSPAAAGGAGAGRVAAAAVPPV